MNSTYAHLPEGKKQTSSAAPFPYCSDNDPAEGSFVQPIVRFVLGCHPTTSHKRCLSLNLKSAASYQSAMDSAAIAILYEYLFTILSRGYESGLAANNVLC